MQSLLLQFYILLKLKNLIWQTEYLAQSLLIPIQCSDFLETTKGLRTKVYKKSLELSSELAEENPYAKKAVKIQKRIFELRAEIDTLFKYTND